MTDYNFFLAILYCSYIQESISWTIFAHRPHHFLCNGRSTLVTRGAIAKPEARTLQPKALSYGQCTITDLPLGSGIEVTYPTQNILFICLREHPIRHTLVLRRRRRVPLCSRNQPKSGPGVAATCTRGT